MDVLEIKCLEEEYLSIPYNTILSETMIITDVGCTFDDGPFCTVSIQNIGHVLAQGLFTRHPYELYFKSI